MIQPISQYCGAVSWLPAVTVFAMWLPAGAVSVYPLHPCWLQPSSRVALKASLSKQSIATVPDWPVVPCWSRWRAKRYSSWSVISIVKAELCSAFLHSPFTRTRTFLLVLLCGRCCSNFECVKIFFNPGKQLRIDSYLQMQAEIHLGSWDFLPFLYTNGALISGKVL